MKQVRLSENSSFVFHNKKVFYKTINPITLGVEIKEGKFNKEKIAMNSKQELILNGKYLRKKSKFTKPKLMVNLNRREAV